MTNQWVSQSYHLWSPWKLLRRSIKFPKFSRKIPNWLKRRILENHIYKHHCQRLAKFWRLRKLLKFLNYRWIKSTIFTKSLIVLRSLSPSWTWQQRVSLEKQVIIPMSNENKAKFMESSSAHITNLNRVLKNIKLEVIADFVCID